MPLIKKRRHNLTVHARVNITLGMVSNIFVLEIGWPLCEITPPSCSLDKPDYLTVHLTNHKPSIIYYHRITSRTKDNSLWSKIKWQQNFWAKISFHSSLRAFVGFHAVLNPSNWFLISILKTARYQFTTIFWNIANKIRKCKVSVFKLNVWKN